MDTITGHHLYSSSGDDIGEVTDVLGAYGGVDDDPTWITVKTGWFSQRLVPFRAVEHSDGQLTTKLSPVDVKTSPKVPVHFEPAGDDLDALRSHYRVNAEY